MDAEIPEDVMKAARLLVASVPTTTAIARALLAERERCAQIAEKEPEFPGEPSDEAIRQMETAGPVLNARAAARATKKSIAKAIRS